MRLGVEGGALCYGGVWRILMLLPHLSMFGLHGLLCLRSVARHEAGVDMRTFSSVGFVIS